MRASLARHGRRLQPPAVPPARAASLSRSSPSRPSSSTSSSSTSSPPCAAAYMHARAAGGAAAISETMTTTTTTPTTMMTTTTTTATTNSPLLPPRRRPSLPRPPPTVAQSRTTRRTFFLDGIFEKPPREVRPPQYEPGWMQIILWRNRMLDRVRPPTRKEMRQAWKRLMDSKLRHRVPFNSTQALQCRRLLEYLVDARGKEEVELVGNEISVACQILVDIEPHERSQSHLDFAKSLYDVWAGARYAGAPRSQTLPWGFLVRALCEYGGSREGLELFLSRCAEPEYATYLQEKNNALVEAVARGLAREGLEEELLKLTGHIESRGVSCGPAIQEVMVTFYAQRGRVAETQHWVGKLELPRAEVLPIIATFAMQHDCEQWASDLLLKYGQMLPRKKHWDHLFQAMLITGKGVEEVDTLMSHMMHRQTGIAPDVATINRLLRVAADARDAALAESILALAASKGMEQDGETYLTLMRLRLRTGDVAAARTAYEQAKLLEPWTDHLRPHLYAEYRRLTNELLDALCAQPRPDFEYITTMLESIEEEQLRLRPSTVAALCLRFLENDQHFEVMDLLAAYSFHYSEAERESVQAALVDFCLSPSTSTNRCWSAYQILHQFFQDTTPARRVDLMDGFFARSRPDMAAQVFGHMRAHPDRAYHPVPATYIRCLEGLARHPDTLSDGDFYGNGSGSGSGNALDMIHNMLKMDVSVQSTTRLLTALMLAYTAAGRPLLALDFWHEITVSREGPSYESLEAVFWALERKPGGHDKARDLWDRIERMDLDITPGVYSAYIGAVAGGGNEKEVRGLVARMPHAVGSEPDAMTLGIAYNALPSQDMQAAFEEWAKPRYRAAWADLVKTGRRLSEYSLCQFRIQRSLKS